MMGSALSFILFLTLGSQFAIADATTWDYSDTNWNASYPLCGGAMQSPINIVNNSTTAANYSDFAFSVGYKTAMMGSISNTGYAIKFSVDPSYGASISGGPLSEPYTLDHLTLHWGSRQGQGSEHTLEGMSYEAEIQFVHYKSSYNNFTEAVADNQTDSLAIVAVFVAEQSFLGDNYLSYPEAVAELMIHAAALSRDEIDTALDMNVTLDQLVSNIGDLSGMYHYEGSLTTPECQEIVQWIVMDKPLYVRRWGLLRLLRKNDDINGDTLEDNYRPTQDLNARTVNYYSV